MKVVSEVTGIEYEAEDCVFFRNYIQAAHYISWGAKLVDMFTDNQIKLVFVFTKDTHNKLKARWGNKESNQGGQNG